MTRMRAVLASLMLLSPVTAMAADDPVTTFTLDNGMQVVVVEDHRAPVVQHMIWYRAGSADEPKGASGVAHFLEHLLKVHQTKNNWLPVMHLPLLIRQLFSFVMCPYTPFKLIVVSTLAAPI